MDPITLSSLISAGGSLLGGLLNKPKTQFVVPDYKKIRAAAEAAGFNPLTALQSAPGQVVSNPGYMGSAIQDASLALADGVSKAAEERTQLEQQNAALQRQVNRLTLRPVVPGVYAQRVAAPDGASISVVGGIDAVAGSSRGGVGAGSVGGRVGGSWTGQRVSATGSGGVSIGGNAVESVPVSAAASDQGTAPPKNPFRFLGFDIYPSGMFSDGSAAENRYSDIGGMVLGVSSGIYDTAWNLGRVFKNRSFDPRYRHPDVKGFDPGAYGPGTVRWLRAEAAPILQNGFAKMVGGRIGARRQDF